VKFTTIERLIHLNNLTVEIKKKMVQLGDEEPGTEKKVKLSVA
jgi:hypothetical protein